jgi:hypothetical protein
VVSALLAMVVCDEVGERPPQVAFTERDHATWLANRSSRVFLEPASARSALRWATFA